MLKQKKGFFAGILAAAMLLAALAGCGGAGTGDTGADAPKVGVVLKSLSNPFYVTMEEAIDAKAQEIGVQVITQAPEKETDAEKQMQIIENLITQNVSALILTPNGSTELVPAIKKANDKNIPVIVVDTRIDEEALTAANAHIECFIGSDNYFGGETAAEELSQALGGAGKVAVLEGISGHESSVSRVGGFTDKAKELGGLEIVASQPADWDQEKGYTVFQNILQANPDITGLFAANDMMALGAVKAIEDMGKSSQITVIGFDATDDAKSAIKDGKMLGSIAQSPDKMGEIALETAKTYLETGSCEAEVPVDVTMLSKDDIQ